MQLPQIRLEAISNINQDIAQVFFAGLFVGPIASGSIELTPIIFGAGLSAMFWTFSILTLKEL